MWIWGTFDPVATGFRSPFLTLVSGACEIDTTFACIMLWQSWIDLEQLHGRINQKNQNRIAIHFGFIGLHTNCCAQAPEDETSGSHASCDWFCYVRTHVSAQDLPLWKKLGVPLHSIEVMALKNGLCKAQGRQMFLTVLQAMKFPISIRTCIRKSSPWHSYYMTNFTGSQ